MPVVLSTVETKAFSGRMWPQIQAVFPGEEPIERSTMNSWDDENFVAAIRNSGRRKIVLAGLWTETCVALPTVQAIHDGYEVYVVEDCCGDVSELSHEQRHAARGPGRRQAGDRALRDARVAARLGAQGHLRRGDGHREEPLRRLRRGRGVRLHHGARRAGDQVPGVRGRGGRAP